MKRLGLTLIVFSAACGGSGSSSTDAGPTDAAIDPVDPDASLCDDGSDGLCADPTTCPSDPNCVTIDAPPGCVPATLPPEPKDLLAGAGLWIVRDVAADGNTVVFSAIAGGQPIVSAKVLSCPSSGCPATPATVGAIGGDPNEGLLAAFDGKVFWARKSANNISTSRPINEVVRANLNGSAVEPLVTGDEFGAYVTTISRATSVYDDYALVFDVSEASSSANGPHAGIRAATTNLLSPALPNVRTPQYGFSAVTGNDNYFAYWASPISGLSTPYDRKLHIYDLDGNQVGSGSIAFTSVSRMQLAGTTLLVMGSASASQSGIYACTLPACSDLHEVGVAANFRGFDFQIRNGRVYFASVEDQGCGMGLTGVLASCDVASFVAGTCTRQLHSTSFHWVNLYRLEVEDGVAYGISKTNTQAVYKVTL